MKNILIIGGAGYVGCELSSELSQKNYNVKVLDLFMYGENVFRDDKNIIKIKCYMRNIKDHAKIFKNIDCVIHLACISNDPSFELDPDLGKSINYDSFEPIIKLAKDSGVKMFIYASSSSVYGIKTNPNVTEEQSLEPLTDYSMFKVKCEEICLKYDDKDFRTVIIRPSTVCGVSKRQRLDLVVNILSNLAFNKGHIKVFGGKQLRPNIHIKDMVRSYIHILESNYDFSENKVFNVGYHNLPVYEIALKVKNVFGEKIKIDVEETNDNRSYHVSSEKIKKILNFENKFSIDDAIIDLKDAFNKKLFADPLNNKLYFNIKMMQSINLK